MSELNHKLEAAKKLAGNGKVSRRDFIQLALAAGITVAAADTMFVDAVRAAPKKGGHFIQGLTGGATTDVLDPAQTLDTYMEQVSFGQLRNNLTEIGPDGKLRPELAESYGSDDAKTWVFKLRKGVEFHNGKSFEAEDIVATMNHHRGKNAKSGAKGIVKQIVDVKADGKDTVVFVLQGPNADWPFIVSDYHLATCPANKDGTMDWQSGNGTGGYKLKHFDPGGNTKTVRNPNYWKPNAAYFDAIDNIFIPDVVARTNALRSGSIYCMDNLDLKTISLLKRDSSLNIFPITGNKHATLPMFCDVKPFSDVNVRLALKYAINREEWLKKILFGQGELGNDSPIGPANIYRATLEEMPQRHYDPEKAKFHLKKAGMSTLKVDFHVANTAFSGAVDAAQLYEASAKACGIDINVVREANDGYWDNVWLKKSWCASYWGGRPTEDWIFSQIYSKGADWNESHWDNARFNKLLVEARGELDPKKRRVMYVEMQKLVRNDGGSVIPMFMAYTHAVSKKIGLPKQIANNWEFDGQKNGERWWFA